MVVSHFLWFGEERLLDGRSRCTYGVRMTSLRFVWNGRKSLTNRRKHGISFEEAQTAFHDENAKVYFDPDHSDTEDRFILLGMSQQLRLLVVCHCYREAESVVRISSARKADMSEQGYYWS